MNRVLPGSSLTDSDFEILQESWISPELAATAMLRRVSGLEAGKLLRRNGGGTMSGILFPYVQPGAQEPFRYRLRLDKPEVVIDSEGHPQEGRRFVGIPDNRNRLYAAPGTAKESLCDSGVPVVFAVGEESVLALYRLSFHGLATSEKPRFLPIGLSSPWGWRGKIGKAPGRDKSWCDVRDLIPDFREFNWAGRKVLVVFGADVATDKSAQSARRQLTEQLMNRCKCDVSLVELPAEAGVQSIGALLALQGPERVLSLLSRAAPADPLTMARRLIHGLSARVKKDPGAPFQPEIIRALTVVHRQDPAEWARLKKVLQREKVSIRDLQANMRRIKSAVELQHGEHRTAGSMLAICPAPDLQIPEHYILTTKSIGREPSKDSGEDEKSGAADIAFSPILITGRLRDVEIGTELLRLDWLRDGGWRHKDVDRGTVMDSRKLLELASDGFPVASDNARELCTYLHKFEALNFEALPCMQVSSHLGWQGKSGSMGFLWGRTLITATPEEDQNSTISIEDSTVQEWDSSVAFRGSEGGDEQLADGYRARGNFEAWRDGLKGLEEYPSALIVFYSSFVPPLLMILNAPSFVQDLCGRTSTGKTTTLRVAASVWGCPDEQQPDAAIHTWDVTPVWAERASAVISALPLILDETKRVKRPDIIQQLIYMVVSGQGRGRGNKLSLDRTRVWKTVLISSGEAPATSYTQAGGTRTRCLEIRRLPFGKQDESTARFTADLNAKLQMNFGHAGPMFVRHLLQNRPLWDSWRQIYQEDVLKYVGRAPEYPEAHRLAQSFAAIASAVKLVHEALDLPWDFDAGQQAIDQVWPEILAEMGDTSGDVRALQAVISWAFAHEETFHGRARIDSNGDEIAPPNRRWSGRWDRCDDWPYVAFYPTVLDSVLRELGYEPEAVLSGWKERGWLDTRKDRKSRYTKQIRLAGGDLDRPDMVVILYQAIREAIEPEEDER